MGLNFLPANGERKRRKMKKGRIRDAIVVDTLASVGKQSYFLEYKTRENKKLWFFLGVHENGG